MPLWNLQNRLNVDIYNNMVDGFKYIQTQMATAKKDYIPCTPPIKIRSDSRDTDTITSDISNIRSIFNKVDKQDKYDENDPEIQELMHLASVFSVNSTNLRKINVNVNNNTSNNTLPDTEERRDSVTSLISVLSDADNKQQQDIYTDTPALKDEQSMFYRNKYYQVVINQGLKTETLTHNDPSPSDEAFPDLPWKQLIGGLTGISKDMILSKHGYKKIRKISDTLQGELIEAIKIESPNIGQHVKIKITNKMLCDGHISLPDQDGFKYCIEGDIRKEALILNHLTKDNVSSGEYITKYLGFFESENDYFLVSKHIEDEMNLKQFIQQAFMYIKSQRLSLKVYQHFVRYVMWQLCALIHWMHDDMNCCHLNLCLENILLRNAQFIENKTDGKITINPSICIKVANFDRSEIFKCLSVDHDEHGSENAFECQKTFIFSNDIQYLSPSVYDGGIYDAKKADTWAIGMMLYECLTGTTLYTKRIENKHQNIGSAFWSLENNKFALYLTINGLKKYINNTKILSLLNGLLELNDEKRLNARSILKHDYFKCYYKSYKQRILKKSISQKKELRQQTAKMKKFPYYNV